MKKIDRQMSVIEDKINFFQNKGYVIFEQMIPHDLIDSFALDFTKLIEENQPLKINLLENSIFLQNISSTIKKQQYLKYGRFVDVEKYSSLCKELIFYPIISNFLTNLYSGNQPTNLQTLTYKYSSQQGEHSDKYLVSPTWAKGYNRDSLTAAWIALEDADESNGALVIYPGSHLIKKKKRLSKDFNNDYTAYVQYCQKICQQHNIKPKYFYAKKGDVLFWHGDFIHAGGVVKNWAKSRFSLVCHYANIKNDYPLSQKNCLYYRPRTTYRNLGYFYEDKITNPQHIKFLVNSVRNWYHRIEFAPNITTSGVYPCKTTLAHLDSLGLPQDGKLLRVLDIGCRDGFFSLEMEARGAEVTAINNQKNKTLGFTVASKIKDSKVAYFIDNFNKLEPQKYGFFDIILFLDIPYQIDHNIDILNRIQKLIKPEGLIFFETTIKPNHRLQKVNLLRQKILGSLGKIFPQITSNQDRVDELSPETYVAKLKLAFEEAEFKVVKNKIDGNQVYFVAKAKRHSEQQQNKFLGSIDQFTSTSISGWAINLEQPDEPVIIVIWQNNQILTLQLADKERSDLREAGYGNGKYGFVIPLPPHEDKSSIKITVTTPQGHTFPDSNASWLVENQ